MLPRGGLRILLRGIHCCSVDKRGQEGRKAAMCFENPPPPICCTNTYPFRYQIRSERTFHSIESSMCSPTTLGSFEVMVVHSRMGKNKDALRCVGYIHVMRDILINNVTTQLHRPSPR